MQALAIRCLDIIISFTLLTILSPILLIIGIAVMQFMGSPVLFRQERLGVKRRKFTILKFRTMRVEALKLDSALTKVNEYTIKVKNDPRVTPLGEFLRKTSLDELPQLINVLRGDMSLVGPRPFVTEEYTAFPELWFQRLNVKPGVTGLAQISGRSDLPMVNIIDRDLQWAKNISVKLYFKILIQTGMFVFSMKNVY